MIETITKAEIKLKVGEPIPSGTPCKLEFDEDRPTGAKVKPEGRPEIRLSCKNLHKYFEECLAPPDEEELEDMHSDGCCDTVTGDSVEPDGHGPDGAPSWLLALGFI